MAKKGNRPSEIYQRISSKVNPIFLLVFIIIAQLIYTSFVFVNYKDNFHSDEIWSFGLSNSYYQPFISVRDGVYIEDVEMEDIRNVEEWLDGSVMNDYITVQPGERFAYDSVYHNQTLDHHPPLYYMLLHTVCSFFPNTFSPYFGFFLNCIFLIVTQIFLYKLARLVFKSKFYALTVCTFYAVGIGALSTFIFIRQYSMLTMLVMMYTYFNAKLFYDPEADLKRKLPPIAVTSFAAFMTHYYAIIFIGAFTAVFCLIWLCRKRIKKMFIYGGTILGTLLLFFAVYPASIMQMSNNEFDGKTKLGFWMQLRVLFAYIARNNMGLRISAFDGYARHTITVVAFSLAVLSVPLCFLFRNEEWFKRFKKALAEYIKQLFSNLRRALLQGDRFPLIIVLAVFANLCVVDTKVNIIKMGAFSQRYVFDLFPFGSFFAVYGVRLIAYLLPKVKKYAMVITAVCIAFLTVDMYGIEHTEFTMDQAPRYQEVFDELAGKNCLIILNYETHAGVFTNMAAFTHKTDHVCYAYVDAMDNYREQIFGADMDIDRLIVYSGTYFLDSEQAAIAYSLDTEYTGVPDEDAAELITTNDDQIDKIRKNTEKINAYFEGHKLVPQYEIMANGFMFYVMDVQ